MTQSDSSSSDSVKSFFRSDIIAEKMAKVEHIEQFIREKYEANDFSAGNSDTTSSETNSCEAVPFYNDHIDIKSIDNYSIDKISSEINDNSNECCEKTTENTEKLKILSSNNSPLKNDKRNTAKITLIKRQ